MTLLTGSLGAAARKTALEAIANGQAPVVVGTHALLQEAVSYSRLDLVVVDEQHRFGVAQREALAAKGVSPHVLRHTCALTILQATRDVRKVALWLGHESTQTTEVYLRLDPQHRLEALAGATPPSLRPGTFSPPDRLIQLLNRRKDYAE